MRKTIREFVELSKSEKEQLWNSATFVFDTNVFLNLYRYSKKTRDALLVAMKELKDRIWMPHQVAFEFMRRRPEVIYESVSRYDKFEKTVFDFCKDQLRMSSDDQDFGRLQDCVQKWTAEVKEHNLTVTSVFEDSTLDALLDLFDGKAGEPYSDEQIKAIKKTGEERYSKHIPPGYKDAKKAKGSDDHNAYGDYIIWMQILDYSKANGKDIIFVTHDQKEDWWQIVSGKTLGPRTELRKEFYDTSDKQFHMYTMENFISYFTEKQSTAVDSSVVEEVKSYSNKPVLIDEDQMLAIDARQCKSDLARIRHDIEYLRQKNQRRRQDLAGINASFTERKKPAKVRKMEMDLRRNIDVDDRRIEHLIDYEQTWAEHLRSLAEGSHVIGMEVPETLYARALYTFK